MEKFYWADQVADKIIKERGKKKEYICASRITPSGIIHIGNFREVIISELVVRALRDKGKKAKFIFSWDDYDRFRKVPANVPKSYEKYIGMPISEIPSPFVKGKSYAQYFAEEFKKQLKKVGVAPEFVKHSVMNKKGKYTQLIKVVIEKRGEIIKILNKYRKEPLSKDWMPITVYCEKCKKDFTKIISIKGCVIEYECSCGYKNKIDFRKKGVVSVPWRINWPLRWKYEKVDFEPGGIDHSVYGGSFMTGKEIAKQVFKYEPPIYQFYDWVKLKGGKEFASSIGNVLTIDDVEEIYEPEILRYLFVGTKPKTGFQISFDNDVIKIYDDYDALEKKYYEKKANNWEKRIYELSQIKLSKTKPNKTSFRHLITLVQTGKTNNLNQDDKKRAKKVKKWLEKYAEEDMKFEIQTKVQVKLNKKEKQALLKLRDILKKKKHSEKELFDLFYEICKDVGISNTEFFRASYRVMINKGKGPRLTNLILNIGQDKIVKLLDQIK
jgi:lysyl-tRNA synthetase class 1